MANCASPCSAYLSSSASSICTGIGAELLEEVLPVALQPLGALAARAQRCVVGDVTEQVERVGVRLSGDSRQFGEVDAALSQRAR